MSAAEIRASNQMMSRRDEVKIAQRFNAGLRVIERLSPEGTAELGRFQPSLRDFVQSGGQPSVETLGYCRWSLRDYLIPVVRLLRTEGD